MINASIKEMNFVSDHDSLRVSAVAAVPTGEVLGVVQIIHGMNEYKERYFDFIDYLAEQGFITVIHDNRGHGSSIVTEEDLGFMFKNGGQGFISDIAQLNAIIHEEYPELPCFMIAHGMGSLGARCFLKEHDKDISGLILTGSPSYNRFSGLARALNTAVQKREKSRYRNEAARESIQKILNKEFGSVPNSWICSRKEVVEEFNANPKSNFIFTINGYESLLYLLKETYSTDGWKINNPHLPIRFLSGKDDPLMISEKKFYAAVELLKKIGYESISHRLFDNMRNEIINEKNNIIVYRDIAKTLFSWIDRINNI